MFLNTNRFILLFIMVLCAFSGLGCDDPVTVNNLKVINGNLAMADVENDSIPHDRGFITMDASAGGNVIIAGGCQRKPLLFVK